MDDSSIQDWGNACSVVNKIILSTNNMIYIFFITYGFQKLDPLTEFILGANVLLKGILKLLNNEGEEEPWP